MITVYQRWLPTAMVLNPASSFHREIPDDGKKSTEAWLRSQNGLGRIRTADPRLVKAVS